MEDQMTIPFVHSTVEYSNYIVADRILIYSRQSSRSDVYYYSLRAKQWLCDLAERFIQRYVNDAMATIEPELDMPMNLLLRWEM